MINGLMLYVDGLLISSKFTCILPEFECVNVTGLLIDVYAKNFL